MEAETEDTLKGSVINSWPQGDFFMPDTVLQEMIVTEVAKKLEEAQVQVVHGHPMS